jgi:hypothetical protein
MKAPNSSVTLLVVYQSTWHHSPEDHNLKPKSLIYDIITVLSNRASILKLVLWAFVSNKWLGGIDGLKNWNEKYEGFL